MVLYLLAGVLVGSLTVLFAMDNTALVTVSFMEWHSTAPLAFILLAAVLVGIALTLLTMLPLFIRNALDEYARRREQRKLETASYATTADQVVA